LAEEAIKKYAGIMPNMDAVTKLGYSVKNPAAISGPIYRKLSDLCAFGLFERVRAAIKTTILAGEALDPYDSAKAADGKARAVRNIAIVGKAFDAWGGEIPDDTAFPAKLIQIAGVDWQEAQKHTEMLKTLFNETFPYLKPSAGVVAPMSEAPTVGRREPISVSTTPNAKPFGELRTTLGSIVIKDKGTLKLATQLLELLGEQFGKEEESS